MLRNTRFRFQKMETTGTTVYENNNGKGGEESIVFDATECRYVKMQGVKRALAYGYSLWGNGCV